MSVLITQKQWKIKCPDPKLWEHISKKLGVDPVLAQLLVNRGIKDTQEAECFLYSDLSKLHDPFELKDMDIAVKRIRQAQQAKECVLIFGDYDVDGVTSSALLHNVFKKMGIKVINHIPHRMHDGYGLNKKIGDVAKSKGVSLIVAVDCGITAYHEVDRFNELGLDCIILDHHEPAEDRLPKALAVIDPKRKDCLYPFDHLASVGLVAKLIQALFGKLDLEDLDLVALGTIADVVQLRGENRIFVKEGLPQISETKNKGLAALMDVARIKGKQLRPYHAGFILGPRINATGRMDSAQKSLDLLLSRSDEEAYLLAKFLETVNSERQKLQRSVIEDAVNLLEREVNFKDHRVIVLSKEGWHKGVLGIVASRLAESYYRPTIIIALQDGVGTASARSIEGFHLHEALAHCSDMLEDYGGHKLAAGLTIREENIEEFRDIINNFAKEILPARELTPTLNIDCEIPLASLNLNLVRNIDLLEPYGEGNPSPVFCTRQLTVKSHPAILGKETLKFWVTDGQLSISVVGFGMAKYKEMIRLGQKVDLAYELIIDEWNKAPTVQLKLKDVKSR